MSETITQTEAVQSWLREASTTAAEDLGQMQGMQGEMRGYTRMMDALEEALPELIAAVNELTDRCGNVDLNWRPHRPTLSRLCVSFDREYTVTLFVRLDACTDEAVQAALDTIADALPPGDPFPNRPNTVTGLVARDGQGIGVRLNERLRENGSGTTRSVTLLPGHRQPQEDLSRTEAVRQLRRALCADAVAE
ncbi:MAG: hypothetical protein BRD55_03020 [Bacteroidetes bacterium SW_9_63_38]|nr:MAG: hypothetical protein BRD55_03020 [Bacteroidetes bacterium SW_9_63_38]